MTDWVALAIAFSGSCDSAAATVAISAPTIENTTTTMLEKIAADAVGHEAAVVGEVAEVEALVGPEPDHEERAEDEERDDREHLDAGEPVLELAVRADREQVGRGHQHHQDRARQIHSGASANQNRRIFAPATASKPTTITQKYQ